MIKQNQRVYRAFIVYKCLLFSVRPAGFEPATLCSGGIRSNPTELRAHIYLYEWVKVAFLIV